MPYRIISIISVLTIIYFFFVYQGAKKKYEINNINKVLQGFGLSTSDFGLDSWELFKIGLGLKN